MQQPFTNIIRDCHYQVQASIGRRPALYYRIYARHFPFSQMAVAEHSDICIEGFPRSANSYAVVAFKLNNPGVKPGHHLHVPAQIIRACNLKKPVITLIRTPEEAVASFLVFQTSLNADLYLKLYTAFYQTLAPFRQQFVVADFNTITTDFNSVIDRVNKKYGMHFNEIKNLAQRQDEIFSKLNEINLKFFSGAQQKSMFPDKRREQIKEQARQLVLKSPQLDAALNMYHSFLGENKSQ